MREKIEGIDNVTIVHDRFNNLIDLVARTVVVLWQGPIRYVGIAECHRNDQFCRKTGFAIAMGRAKFAMQEHKTP